MRKMKQQKYFSLVELMVVVVILGLLAGLAGVAVIHKVDDAKVEKTRSDIITIEKAAKLFRLDTGKYPAALEELVQKPSAGKGWKGPYLDKGLSPDSWSNAYIYVVNQGDRAKPIVIHSMGPDGIDGNSDDISNYDDIEGGAEGSSSGGGMSLDDAPVN